MKRVYVETTVISYLAALSSRDLIKAARQQITWEWWNNRRARFELYVSELVIEEVAAGDPGAAARRLGYLDGIAVLDIRDAAEELAYGLILNGRLPEKAADDALHLAVAAIHGMDYLMTWNCAHLANAELLDGMEGYLLDQGYRTPRICTPDELLEPSDG